MAKKVIIVEGTDGVGKESVCKKMCEHYGNRAMFITAPHYEDAPGKLVKELLHGEHLVENPMLVDPYTMAQAYILDRNVWFQNHMKEIEAADLLIMDRGWLSNIMYQGSKFFFKNILEFILTHEQDTKFIGFFESKEAFHKYALEIEVRELVTHRHYLGIVNEDDQGIFIPYLYGGDIGLNMMLIAPDNFYSNKGTRECVAEHKAWEFYQWEYETEVAHTFLKDVDSMEIFFLSFNQNPVDDIILSISTMAERGDLDVYEKGVSYRMMVAAYMSQFFNNFVTKQSYQITRDPKVKMNVGWELANYITKNEEDPPTAFQFHVEKEVDRIARSLLVRSAAMYIDQFKD